MRRHKSLLNTIKRRVALRRTKSDQFLEVRAMPIKDVISEMDDFFNQLKTIQELYKKMRLEHVRHTSIKLLAEIDKAKKGFVRAVTLVRTFRDSLPKWDPQSNLILAKKLFDRGYSEEAYIMCESLGVNYHDYFAPIKARKEAPKRKKPLLSQAAIKILEKNNPLLKEPKVVPIHEGPKETYYLFVSPRNFCVHNRKLSKKLWAATHLLHCVEVPRTMSTFDPTNPKIGQYVCSKKGKWLQVQFIRKKEIATFAAEEKERKRIEAEQLRIKEKKKAEREAELKKIRAQKKLQKYNEWRAKRGEIKKQKLEQARLDRIAEEQRKKQEQLELERQERERNKPLTYKQLVQIRGRKPRQFGVKLTGTE